MTASNHPMPGIRQAPAIPVSPEAPPVAAPVPAGRSANADYLELRRIVKERGLLAPQPAYLVLKIVSTLAMLAAGLGLLAVIDNPWLRLLDAAFLAFVFTQIGLVGHDIGHRQTLRAGPLSAGLGLLFGNLLLGISRHWWIDKHNRHHSHTNEVDGDPDIAIPLIAFTEEAALGRRGLSGLIVRHQAILLFPLMHFQALSLRQSSIQFLLTQRAKYHAAEIVLLVLHAVLYVGLIAVLVGGWQAVIFIVVHQALFGLYMSSIFAPNHKGMPIWAADAPPDFLRQQVITSRNVRAHPLTDFWYGGLNYQIEHHLFPTMPRNRLREAQQIVRAFCQARGIPYHETSFLQSYREILAHLHAVGAPLRARARHG